MKNKNYFFIFSIFCCVAIFTTGCSSSKKEDLSLAKIKNSSKSIINKQSKATLEQKTTYMSQEISPEKKELKNSFTTEVDFVDYDKKLQEEFSKQHSSK